MIQSYINHVVLVLDQSASMSSHSQQLIKVVDNQIAHLARRSKELDQETRVSVYLFADDVSCLIYDKDCLRLPSLASHYRPHGNTALLDATNKAIEDLEKTATLYGDHSFLVYCLTDGEENRSRPGAAAALAAKIRTLPDNWTLAVFVPNQMGKHEAKRFGFPADNISVWDTSSATAVEDAGKVMQQATETFMRARSTGVRGTKNLFAMDATKLTNTVVQHALTELSPTQYSIFPVPVAKPGKKQPIKEFVEGWTKEPYRIGSAYYALTKPEKVQNHKQVCLQHKITGKVYAGAAARQILGLPDHEVKVEPTAHPDYTILLQSSSTNRLLVGGTNLLVMK